MKIRIFKKADCMAVYQLFHDTVHSVNTRDYSINQVEAWANTEISQDYLDVWCQALLESYTLVIVKTFEPYHNNEFNEQVIGFGNLTKDGYLDRLYVHKDHIGKGIGNQLADQLEAYAKGLGLKEIVTHASITARPFFEKRGYQLIKEQTVERNNQQLTNYIMIKQLHKY